MRMLKIWQLRYPSPRVKGRLREYPNCMESFRCNANLLQDGLEFVRPPAWYITSRVVGDALYTGSIATSGIIHDVLRVAHVLVDIHNVSLQLFIRLTAWCNLYARSILIYHV